MKIFSCNSFTGGMNDWIHPMLLESNIAAKLVNADISTGKLVPIRHPLKLAGTTPEYYGNYGSHDRSAIKYNGRNYWSNNRAASAPYYGGDPENFLGVPYPTYGAGDNVQVDFTNSGNLTGEYKYCVTFVTENGWEGAPGSLTDYEVGATIEDKSPIVTVTWDVTDTRISYAKIYRTADHGADFFNIGEIHYNALTETFDTFTDTIPDEEAVLLNPLTSEENYPPPDAGKYLTENNGVFFLAQGPLLYFSALGNPHAWPTTQFITFDDEITGITQEFIGVLVFTRNKTYRVIGADNPQTVQKIFIPGNHGCISWRSIAMLNNAPVWLSNDGICLWDGNTISVPSYRVIKTEGPESVQFAATANDCYYLFLRRYAIIYDIRNGGIFYKFGLTYDYAWFDVGSGVFYLHDAGGCYKYNGSEEPMTIQYSSPYIGGSESGVKIYREIYIVCEDTVHLSASVDGVPLWNDPVSVPAGKQRIKFPIHSVGHYLSISLESSGSIRELQVLYD